MRQCWAAAALCKSIRTPSRHPAASSSIKSPTAATARSISPRRATTSPISDLTMLGGGGTLQINPNTIATSSSIVINKVANGGDGTFNFTTTGNDLANFRSDNAGRRRHFANQSEHHRDIQQHRHQ